MCGGIRLRSPAVPQDLSQQVRYETASDCSNPNINFGRIRLRLISALMGFARNNFLLKVFRDRARQDRYELGSACSNSM